MSDDYDVGYKKPPKNKRWAKGQSGNPSGLSKYTTDIKQTFNRVLSGPVTVRVNGKTEEVSALEALTLRTAEKAMKGDAKVAIELMKLAIRMNPSACRDPEPEDKPTGGVLVVPASQSIEEWVREHKMVREAQLAEDSEWRTAMYNNGLGQYLKDKQAKKDQELDAKIIKRQIQALEEKLKEIEAGGTNNLT